MSSHVTSTREALEGGLCTKAIGVTTAIVQGVQRMSPRDFEKLNNFNTKKNFLENPIIFI